MPDETKSDVADDVEQKPWWKRYFWLLALAALITVAPSAISITGQSTRVLSLVYPSLADATTIQSANLHWWSRVELRGLSVEDLSKGGSEQTPLCTIESVTSKQSLWELALSGGNGVEVTLHEPALNLRVDEGATNVEETLTRIFGASNGRSSESSIAVNVTSGRLMLFTSQSAATSGSTPVTVLGPINGRLSTSGSTDYPEILLSALVDSYDENATTPSAAVHSGANPRIAAALDSLAADTPLIPFRDHEIEKMTSKDLPAAIGVKIAPATAAGVGQACAIQLAGIDLARIEPLLQRMLPGTHWRGTVSGKLDGILPAASTSGFAGRLFLKGDDVRIRSDSWASGEAVDLQTLSASGAFAIADDGVLLQEFTVTSPVIRASGGGEIRRAVRSQMDEMKDAVASRSPSYQRIVDEAAATTQGNVQVTATIDAAAISRMLPATLHMSSDASITSAEVQVSMRLNSVAAVGGESGFSSQEQAFRWQVTSSISPITAIQRGKPLRIESSLRLDAVGEVSAHNAAVDRIRVEGDFGFVNISRESPNYVIEGTLQPQTLWQQFKDLTDLPKPNFADNVMLSSRVAFADDATTFTDLKLESSDLSISSQRLTVGHNRSLLQLLDGMLIVKGNSSSLKSILAPWHSADWLSDQSAVAFQMAAVPGERYRVRGLIEPSSGAAGQGGNPSNSGAFELNEATIDVELVTTNDAEVFSLQNSKIALPGFQSDISGTLTAPDGMLLLNVQADTTYDLETVSQRYFSEYKETIQLVGRKRSMIHIQGCPMILTDEEAQRSTTRSASTTARQTVTPLQVQAEFGWDRGQIYGLALGSSETRVQLKNGLVRAEPIRCTIGSGELYVMPQLDIDRGLIQLASGSRVENLTLTPQLCSEWLEYVAPLLSDAALVEGQVSARVQRFDWFCDRTEQRQVHGTLSIHHANAGAGPSLQPLLQVLELMGKRSLSDRRLTLPSQNVPVELNGETVSHEGLMMELAGYRLTSTGSVGLNKQINLVLDIPLERSTVTEAGQSLSVPVAGTVGQPRVDVQGLLQNAGRQQIESRVNDQIDRGLNNLLKKLR